MVSIEFTYLKQSSGGYQYILVVVHHFTKYVHEYGGTAADRIFNDFIQRFVFPEKIHHTIEFPITHPRSCGFPLACICLLSRRLLAGVSRLLACALYLLVLHSSGSSFHRLSTGVGSFLPFGCLLIHGPSSLILPVACFVCIRLSKFCDIVVS